MSEDAFRRPPPTGGFERYAWFFMRLSGVALLVLAVFHLVWMHHVIGVEHLSFAVVAERWAGAGWRLYDLALLWLALIHGANGLRVVLEEHVASQGWRRAVQSLTALVGLILLALGTYIVLAFRPPA